MTTVQLEAMVTTAPFHTPDNQFKPPLMTFVPAILPLSVSQVLVPVTVPLMVK